MLRLESAAPAAQAMALSRCDLPEPDRRMDVDRVEGHRIVERGVRHLLGHPERHLVGGAGDEGVERHARVDGGAGEGIAAGEGGLADRPDIAGGRRIGGGLGGLVRGLQRGTGLAVDAHGEVETLDLLGLGPEGLEDLVGVVRLDPCGEKAGRHARGGRRSSIVSSWSSRANQELNTSSPTAALRRALTRGYSSEPPPVPLSFAIFPSLPVCPELPSLSVRPKSPDQPVFPAKLVLIIASFNRVRPRARA